jgi:hypothetical protein
MLIALTPPRRSEIRTEDIGKGDFSNLLPNIGSLRSPAFLRKEED